MIVYGILLFIEAALMFAILELMRNLTIVDALPYLILVMFVQIWCGLCFGKKKKIGDAQFRSVIIIVYFQDFLLLA